MDREISERLTEALQERAPELADKLQPALTLASNQAEILCPAIVGGGRNGIVASLAAYVNHGTWLIILANPKKVFTFHLLPPPKGMSRGELLEHCVANAIEIFGHVPSPEETLFSINATIAKFGGAPGKRTPNMGTAGLNVLGLLFAATTREARQEMVTGIEQVIAANVCPLQVGLVGKGSKKGTSCGVWPISLPFAHYVEYLTNTCP